MKHPLIDFLLTPLAPPETQRLMRLRRTWVVLCALLFLAVPLNAASVRELGPLGALPALLLLVATPALGLVYFRARARAFSAHDRRGKP
jgi:hypothetical protein